MNRLKDNIIPKNTKCFTSGDKATTVSSRQGELIQKPQEDGEQGLINAKKFTKSTYMFHREKYCFIRVFIKFWAEQ